MNAFFITLQIIALIAHCIIIGYALYTGFKFLNSERELLKEFANENKFLLCMTVFFIFTLIFVSVI